MDLIERLHGAGFHDEAYCMYEGCGRSDCSDCNLRPIISRQGNKYRLKDKIIPLIPNHKIYVEPFAGSAAIFFAKPKAEYNVLNELDKDTYNFLKLLQTAPTDIESYPDSNTLEGNKKIFLKPVKTKQDKIVHYLIKACSGFNAHPVSKTSQMYRSVSIHNKVKKINELKQKLKDVIITNKDYTIPLKQYDGKDTFFFLDPPYENSGKKLGYAQGLDFDFNKLNDALLKIKGNFLMTINDSPNIRKIFNTFYQRPFIADTQLKTVTYTNPSTGITTTKPYKRKELFISNYKL